MLVSEVSAELGVPVSAVLECCERLGIDATSAGSDVVALDVSRLRGDSLLNQARGLPPTGAGFLPGPETVQAEPAIKPDATRTFDRRAGAAVISVLIALGLLVITASLSNIFVVVGLWVAAVVALVTSLTVGRRSWRRARVRGDRYWGSWLAPMAMVVALAGLGGLCVATYTAVRSAPAEDAPLGIGELSSVQRVRWGYQRTRLLMGNGWKQPVKVPGTCWIQSDRERDQGNRPAERIEVGNVSVTCNMAHNIEVLDTYNISRDADSPYPGAEALVADGQQRCADDLARAQEVVDAEQTGDVSLLVEIPTEQGWADADHSVACVAVTAEREAALFSGG